jgi:hypothetical protein
MWMPVVSTERARWLADPTLYGNLNFSVNGPHYRVRGAEGDVIFRVTEALTVNSSFA